MRRSHYHLRMQLSRDAKKIFHARFFTFVTSTINLEERSFALSSRRFSCWFSLGWQVVARVRLGVVVRDRVDGPQPVVQHLGLVALGAILLDLNVCVPGLPRGSLLDLLGLLGFLRLFVLF